MPNAQEEADHEAAPARGRCPTCPAFRGQDKDVQGCPAAQWPATSFTQLGNPWNVKLAQF